LEDEDVRLALLGHFNLLSLACSFPGNSYCRAKTPVPGCA
jgi:hypothetical protein